MARPGNRPSTPPRIDGRPGNRVPGAYLLPNVLSASIAAARLEQVSSQAAIEDEIGNLPPPEPGGVRTVTSSSVFGPTDRTILADAAGGPITVVLPARSGKPRHCELVKIDATENVVTLSAPPGDTINGAADISVTFQYDQIGAMTDGISQWVAT